MLQPGISWRNLPGDRRCDADPVTWCDHKYRVYWRFMHPFRRRLYQHDDDEGQERVQAAYRDNYPRLVEIKKKYDPTNLFHMNQNIKPVS
jgi:FAD/FMN-containing dehydrogenase